MDFILVMRDFASHQVVISTQEMLILVDMQYLIILHSDRDISLDNILEQIVDLPS